MTRAEMLEAIWARVVGEWGEKNKGLFLQVHASDSDEVLLGVLAAFSRGRWSQQKTQGENHYGKQENSGVRIY